MKFSKTRITLFAMSGLVSVFLGFFAFSTESAISIVKHWGYWVILGTVVLLLSQLAAAFWNERVEPRFSFLALVLILGASAVLLGFQPSGFKILMDEPVLAATGLQMHVEKEVMTVARLYSLDGDVLLLDAYLDKRPFFYPFLLSLLHDLAGYRAHQGVLLNAFLTPVFLGLLFLTATRLFGRYAGYFAVLLFATVPLLAMNARGAGFELLNLVMILAVVLSAIRYLDRPNGARMNVLLLLAVLLAQTRYESALYVFPVGSVILWAWWKNGEIRITKTMLCVPLLLILYGLQQSVFTGDNPELWQLKGDATQPFSLSFIGPNLVHAAQYFFAFDVEQPNSLLLSVLFVIAVLVAPFIAFLGGSTKESIRSRDLPIILLFGGAMCFSFALLMAYHWGQLDDIIATRIVLPFILFQVFLVSWVYARIARRPGWREIGLIVCVVFCVGVTFSKTAQTDFLDRSRVNNKAQWLRKQMETYEGRQVLFVSDLHMIAVVEQVSSIPTFMAPRRKMQIDFHQQQGTFEEILFCFSLVPDVQGGMAPPEELNRHFDLELLELEEVDPGHWVQLASLKSIRILPEDGASLTTEMPDPEHDPEGYFEFFARSLP